MYKTKKQLEKELEKLEDSFLKPKIDAEKREKYNTRPLKTFSDDECKDFELAKNYKCFL